MYKSFAQQFYKNLIKNQYTDINLTIKDYIVNDETDFILTEKEFGPNLYIIIAYNLDVYDVNYCINSTRDLYTQIQNSPITTMYKHINIVNIFVSSNITSEKKRSINGILSMDGIGPLNKISATFWHININENTKSYTLEVGKNQPSKILNLNKILDTTIKELHIDTDETYIKEIENNAKSEFSKNIVSYDIDLTGFITITLFIFFVLTSFDNVLLDKMLLTPTTIADGEYYRLVSSGFVHIGFIHFFANSLALYIFGARVERYIGKSHFILIFIFSIIIGNLFTLYLADFYSAGASGGIMGLAGALLAYVYIKRISTDNLGLDIVLSLVIVYLLSGFLNSNTNNISHIFGFLTGLFISLYIIKKNNK